MSAEVHCAQDSDNETPAALSEAQLHLISLM